MSATSHLSVLLATGLFALALHYAYKTTLSPAFTYSGLTYREPESLNYAVALLLTGVVALLLPRRISKPSDFVLWVLFLVSAAPSMLLGQYSRILTPDQATVTAFWVGGSLVLARAAIGIFPSGLVPRLELPSRAFWRLFIGFSVVINIYLVFIAGVDLRLVALADVYDLRSEYKASAPTAPLLGYVLGIQYNVVNPVLILRGFYARRYTLLGAGIAGQVIIYSATGFKSVLFATPALIAASWIFRSGRQPNGSSLVFLAGLGALGALALDKVLGGLTFSSLFVRRFLVIPGLLTSVYVLVFADRPKTLFSDSLFPFLEFPYDVSPVNLVGLVYFGDASTAANASLFGHGYLNAGYPGMVLECLVLALLLRITNDAGAGLPVAVSSLLFLLPAISLSNASIFTVILTHGFLGAVLVTASLPRSGWRALKPT